MRTLRLNEILPGVVSKGYTMSCEMLYGNEYSEKFAEFLLDGWFYKEEVCPFDSNGRLIGVWHFVRTSEGAMQHRLTRTEK